MPMKATVKESEDGQFVLRTVDRSRLWEIQTPQVGQTVRCVCDVWTLCSENVHTTRDVARPDARPAQAITRVRHRENDDDDDDDNEEEEEDDDHDDDDDDADDADVKNDILTQVIRPSLLREGFEKVASDGCVVTAFRKSPRTQYCAMSFNIGRNERTHREGRESDGGPSIGRRRHIIVPPLPPPWAMEPSSLNGRQSNARVPYLM